MNPFEDMPWLVRVLLVGVVALIAITLWSASKNSRRPTIELTKAEWMCTEQSQRTFLQPTPVGKVTVMIPHTRTQCDRWERRP